MWSLFIKFGIVALFFLAGCKGTYISKEISIIKNGEGVMRVWKIDDREDSLFLRRKSKELTYKDVKMEIYQILKQRMLVTVNDSTDPGVGIAAPQVGIGKRLIAVQRFDKPGTPFEFYINPKIEYASGSKSLGKEGCLSVPVIAGEVWRSDELVISYIPDPEGRDKEDNSKDWKRVKETIKGFTAVIFQHEIDHLDGILFIDKMIKGNTGDIKQGV